MGWASAGMIFDRVARALVKTDIGVNDMIVVLYELAVELRDGDWDTEDESIAAFRDQPAVVMALRMAMGDMVLYAESGYDATIEFQPGGNGPVSWDSRFVLRQYGEPDLTGPATQDGWNALVGRWLERQAGNVDEHFARSLPI